MLRRSQGDEPLPDEGGEGEEAQGPRVPKGGGPDLRSPAIFPHLAGREVVLDATKSFGVRRFTSNLPGDFGLRAVMGRLPAPDRTPRQLRP